MRVDGNILIAGLTGTMIDLSGDIDIQRIQWHVA
jgi:hypothetical protein